MGRRTMTSAIATGSARLATALESEPPSTPTRDGSPDWTRLPDSTLLDRPIRSLGLRIEGTPLERRLAQLHAELDRAGLRFRPYAWLSTDWFTPHGMTGFAIPFYLAHPRLTRIERRIMLEAEGGSVAECMRLLRHETAHALDHAYRLHWRKRWREVFGRASEPYRATYVPHPTSRDYVHHLDYFYSQSHPCEDFAETFAVWLQPRSRWRHRYRDWPAIRKLEFVDSLMKEIGDQPVSVRTRARPDSLGSIRFTLRQYYRDKQDAYREEHTDEFDVHLERVFSRAPFFGRRETAARFLLRSRRELRERVAVVTGQHQYVIDQVLNELVLRCRKLDLRVARPERATVIEAASLLTAITMGVLRGPLSEYRR